MSLDLDELLDRSIVLGYSRIGYVVRSRGWAPDDPPPDALLGKRVLVTGATSGIGRAAAAGCARLGATVHVLGRNPDHTERTLRQLRQEVPAGDFIGEQCDVSSLEGVRSFAAGFGERVPRLHGLAHNAGTMTDHRTETAEGHEVTLATHVLGPLLLTRSLRPQLRAAAGAQVVFVSSGGMYAQRLHDQDPEFREGKFSGLTAYARTKRMQVVLAEDLAEELAEDRITVHSMHPGWVNTPGVQTFLPRFRTVARPVIRTPQEGADTVVWLLAGGATTHQTGKFWHDRARRPTHYTYRTRESGLQRKRFRDFCRDATAT